MSAVPHPNETVDQPWNRGHEGAIDAGPPMPGLLLVFHAQRPQLMTIPLVGRPLAIGRGAVGPMQLDDAAMSRRHAEVRFDGERWHVNDLGSRNGTAVDARPLTMPLESATARVLRCGDTLFLLCRDLRPYVRAAVDVRDGIVLGPTLRRVWDEIDSIAAGGPTLHITGETGAGKELAARRFHDSGPRRDGRFIAVNCAAVPAAIAERLLFGARRGAYSGADADSEGYVQAAHGGTLFLDEVAELEAPVQAKLLRMIETREVLPLGAAQARKVDVRICSATHGGLSARVADGKFREDLYFRLGRPEVRLPPLRERAEEIPWLVESVLAGGARAHVSLVEKALAHAWPGNVRELVLELREALRRAQLDGAAAVEGRHLGAAAPSVEPAATVPLSVDETVKPARPRAATPTPPPSKEQIEAALKEQSGNVARTARALGVHRTQLRRWLERYGLIGSGGATPDGDGDGDGDGDSDSE
jgi:transcriptional regulator with GAF, ATPase, and Fis domain